MKVKDVKCPLCHGDGGWIDPVLYDGAGGGPREICGLCRGEGEVNQKERMKYVRSHRRAENEG